MQTILEWQAPEHRYVDRSRDWYWIFGAIILALSFLSFYMGNVILGILILVAGITIGILSYKETKLIDIKLTDQGIVAHRSLYPYPIFRSFWIEDDHHTGARLLLHPIKSYLPLNVFPVGEDVDLDHLREIMMHYLDEEFLEESFVHKIFDYIGI